MFSKLRSANRFINSGMIGKLYLSKYSKPFLPIGRMVTFPFLCCVAYLFWIAAVVALITFMLYAPHVPLSEVMGMNKTFSMLLSSAKGKFKSATLLLTILLSIVCNVCAYGLI